MFCLTQNDWKIEAATDDFYQNPTRYLGAQRMINPASNVSMSHSLYGVSPQSHSVAHSSHGMDRKKLDTLFSRYKGNENEKFLGRFGLFD